MIGYLVNFGIYTMAMLGLIFFALMVYKKFSVGGGGILKSSKEHVLSVEETISIAPRKTLYVVRADNERFLIAGDIDKTTLISKLGNEGISDVKASESVMNIKNDKGAIVKAFDSHIEKQEAESVNNITTPIKAVVKNNIKTETSGVEDLPIIVDFQKKVKKNPSVLHDMLTKMNG